MTTDFLSSHQFRPWESGQSELESDGFLIGNGTNALEIVVTHSQGKPTKETMRRAWNDRQGGRANPILLVSLYDGKAGICGPTGEMPPVQRDLDVGQIERICAAALDKPDRHAARKFLREMLAQIDEELVGLRNQGLLSTHELRTGVPERSDWERATEQSTTSLDKSERALIESLGYQLEPLSGPGYMLTDDGRQTALAVFLEEGESFEHPQERFSKQTPVSYALNKAEDQRVDFVVGNAGRTLRLYTTDPDAGFGSRGRTDTYVEANLDLLPEDNGGYLQLLFSAAALRDDGTLHEIMERSKDYAADLGARLRERIYDDVVPQLAEAIAGARNLSEPTKDELDETYRMTLVTLYRLLFIAYAEDEDFLPRHNPRYDDRSLKQKAHEVHDVVEAGRSFDARSTSHWDDVMRLVDAIHTGHDEWGLPEYDGRLLSSEPDVSEAGSRLASIELTNDQFGPVLANLLVDETVDGYQGPVDFRNIGVREFGVIYEGLLESELSVAEQPLGLDSDGRYEPVNPEEEPDRDIAVGEGEVYLHGQSGERKATGTYYTKTRFVEHLLEHSLDKALDEHLDRLDGMTDREAEAAFFDLRVADIAMGSGHFLVGAVDHIESQLSAYLVERPLPGVENELDGLRKKIEKAFEGTDAAPVIEQSQLLRRQVARRCIYGVDLNPLATELARLSLWVHTFVPGLPLTFLDYNLVTGDSLAGIGTLEEVSDILDVDQTSLGMFAGGSSVMADLREDIDELGRSADADAAEVREARETRREIERRLGRTRAAFDILAASRIDEDIDPTVVNDDGDLTGTSDHERARAALESTDPLHFPAAFPEVFQGENAGFDVIVGNPPWEKTKVEEHEFWARHQPGLRAMSRSDRKDRIKSIRQERPDLVGELEREREEEATRAEMLINGPYPGIGSGDPDFYQAFSWRFWNILGNEGHLGVVLPREAFLSKGSEAFRRHLFETGVITDMTFVLNNRKWAFEEIHPQTTISLSSAKKSLPGEGATVPIRGPYPSKARFDEGIEKEPHRFQLGEVFSWTETASLPLLPSNPKSIKVFDQIQQAPAVVGERTDWSVIPYRNGITSSNCLDEEEARSYGKEVWPVYKGESFDIWTPDRKIYYGWGKKSELIEYLQSKRKRSRKWPDTDRELPCFRPSIAFRRVTRATDSRTIRAALIPPKVFIRDADPFLIWERGDEKAEAYLIGILSSIPADWYARRFVEKHLDFYIFNGIPVPRLDTNEPLHNRAIELAGRLAAVDERYAEWADAVGVEYGPLDEAEKQDKIYELDALVAHLYGLSPEHLRVIFDTFHDAWNHTQRLNRVLEYYNEWADRLDGEDR